MHVEIPQNLNGRDFVMGDLHGCFALLQEKLAYIGFNPKSDRLFSVGDIIDRGPDSLKCLELLDLPWLIITRGNHEQMLINSVLGDDGTDWATQYGQWSDDLPPQALKNWARRLDRLPHALTLNCGGFKVGICHAEPAGYTWDNAREDNSASQMLWGRKTLSERPKTNVDNIDITLHGHTPLGEPTWIGNRYFIDTGACESGTLTLRNIGNIWDEYLLRTTLFK